MPPITLKLDAYVYNYLYTLRNQAKSTITDVYTSKQDYFSNPSLLTLAELKLVDPMSFLFPKKGKAVRFTLAQAVTLHTAIQLALHQELTMPDYLYSLYSLLDFAITNYNPVYGYRG